MVVVVVDVHDFASFRHFFTHFHCSFLVFLTCLSLCVSFLIVFSSFSCSLQSRECLFQFCQSSLTPKQCILSCSIPPCFVFFIWELHWHFQEITATFARNRRRTHNQQRKKYMMKMNLWPINYLPADAESLSNDTINSTFTAQYVSFVRRFAASVYSSISPIHMNSTRSQIHEIRNGGNHLFSVAGFFFASLLIWMLLLHLFWFW